MTSAPSSPGPLRVVAAASGFGAIAVSAVLVLGIGMPSGHTLIAAVSAVALALAFVLRNPAEDAVGRRGGAVLAVALAGFAPCIALGASSVLAEPIITTRFRCGTGLMMMLMLLPFFIFFIGATSGIVSAVALGTRRRLLDRGIDAAAAPAAVIALLFVSAGIVAAARCPAADRYVASLPLLATIGPSTVDAPNDAIVGDYILRRECEASSCRVGLRERNAPGGRDGDDPRSLSEIGAAAFEIGTGAFDVRRDDAHGLLFFVVEGRGVLAFDHEGTPVDVYPSDVADRLGPPPLWVATAGLGLVVAVAALASRRRLRAELTRLTSGAAGRLTRDEWITCEGETAPLRKPHDLALDEGPVVVMHAAGEDRWTYRADGSRRPAIVVPGDKAELVARLADAIVSQSALAICAVAVTIAPLALAV